MKRTIFCKKLFRNCFLSRSRDRLHFLGKYFFQEKAIFLRRAIFLENHFLGKLFFRDLFSGRIIIFPLRSRRDRLAFWGNIRGYFIRGENLYKQQIKQIRTCFSSIKYLPDIILNLDKVTLATGGNVRKFKRENWEKNLKCNSSENFILFNIWNICEWIWGWMY